MVRVGQTSIGMAAGLLTLGLALSSQRAAAGAHSVLAPAWARGDSSSVVLKLDSANHQGRQPIPNQAVATTPASAPATAAGSSSPPDWSLPLPWWGLGGIVGALSLVGIGLWWRSRQPSPNPAPPLLSNQDTMRPGHNSATSQDPPPGLPVAETGPAPSMALTAPPEETSRLTPVNIVDTLIDELASADPTMRHRAIWELGQRGHSAAIQPLINGLLTADSQEKSLILAALAEISSRSLKPMHRALALGLQDPSPEVRKNAIRDLSRVYDTTVQLSHMLAHATQDPDLEVQETARWALEQLNRIRASSSPESLPPESAYVGDRLPPSP